MTHTVRTLALLILPVTLAGQEVAPTGTRHAHEPAGYERFVEADFTDPKEEAGAAATRVGQWEGRGPRQGNLRLEVDSSAPQSPPAVMTTRFPRGLLAGRGPVEIGAWAGREGGGPLRYRAIYFTMWVKIKGRDFYQNSSGTKMGYFGYGRSPERSPGNEGIIILEGRGAQHFTASAFALHFYQGGHTRPERVLRQNADRRELMTVGRWHQWELLMEANERGHPNGVLRMWIDGIQIMDYHNLTFITPQAPNGFFSWRWNPTWGGGQGPRIRDDFMEIDHVYISGQTGVPIHFHSSMISGATERISPRIRAKVSPRQSPRLLMRLSMRREAASGGVELSGWLAPGEERSVTETSSNKLLLRHGNRCRIGLAGLCQAVRRLKCLDRFFDCGAQGHLLARRDKLHVQRIPHSQNLKPVILVYFPQSHDIALVGSLPANDENAVTGYAVMVHAIGFDLARAIVEMLQLQRVAAVGFREGDILSGVLGLVFCDAGFDFGAEGGKQQGLVRIEIGRIEFRMHEESAKVVLGVSGPYWSACHTSK